MIESITPMNERIIFNKSAGFILPSILCLLSLISLIIGLSYQYLYIELQKSTSLTIHQKIFEATEKKLHECQTHIHPPFQALQVISCCVIEYAQDKNAHHYFRISTHILGVNLSDPKQVLGQSRQQSFISGVMNRHKKIIVEYKNLAWREILDMAWEDQLMHKQTNPWTLIKPCTMQLNKFI